MKSYGWNITEVNLIVKRVGICYLAVDVISSTCPRKVKRKFSWIGHMFGAVVRGRLKSGFVIQIPYPIGILFPLFKFQDKLYS